MAEIMDVLVAGYQDIDEDEGLRGARHARQGEERGFSSRASSSSLTRRTAASRCSRPATTSAVRGRAGAAGWARSRPVRAAAARLDRRRGGRGQGGRPIRDHRVEQQIHDNMARTCRRGSAGMIATSTTSSGSASSRRSRARCSGRCPGDKKGTGALKESLAEAMGKFSLDRTVLLIPVSELRRRVSANARPFVADWTINMTPSLPEGARTCCWR